MCSVQELIRLARRLHAVYEQCRVQREQEQQIAWNHLQERFEQAHRQRHLLEKARSRGWHLAADQQQNRLQSVLRTVHDAVREMQGQLLEPPYLVPCLKDLLAELQYLDMEFDEIVIDKKNFLAVQTKSIVLKGIDLGRFSLRLHWPRLAQNTYVECFEVVALDPNPASGNQDVPHPHVRSRLLCTGEATMPLQKALEQGRLTDAFHLIRSVLETYNPDSAYTSLDDWEGVSCWNCGCSTSEDDRSFCEGCDRDVCYDCTSSCKQCDHMRCTSCQTRCDVCNEACCYRCLTTSACSELGCCKDCLRVCAGCSAEVAPGELDGETELCPTCREAQTTTKTDESENESVSVGSA